MMLQVTHLGCNPEFLLQGKFGIGMYISHSSMGSSYGSAGSLLILLLWVYYSSIILYFDAEFTKAYALKYGCALISLTVFSFSLMMIVLNQAASQMSNRVLTSIIENRFQQIILDFYIGTIVYALFLLSTIRGINSGIYVPALSIYLLILLTVVDIFLFIYFLD